jgi:hypothetical protein
MRREDVRREGVRRNPSPLGKEAFAGDHPKR